MRPLAPPAAVAASVLVLGACGGPGAADAVNVARTWLHAVRTGEETAACGLMAPGAARAVADANALDPRASCTDVVRAFHTAVGDDVLDETLDAGMHVRGGVHHDRAAVVAEDPAHRRELVSMRYDGHHWSVAGASALRRP